MNTSVEIYIQEGALSHDQWVAIGFLELLLGHDQSKRELVNTINNIILLKIGLKIQCLKIVIELMLSSSTKSD